MVHTVLDEMKASWPGWNVWVTGKTWVATRRGPRPDYAEGLLGLQGDLALTLIEDDPHELQIALEKQAEIEAEITASSHAEEHSASLSCALSCLKLEQATENALIAHWIPGGQYAPTVGDLLNLRETGSLAEVPRIGRARAAEIETRLEAFLSEARR